MNNDVEITDDNSEPNLAKIVKIKSISPIENADKIELVEFEDSFWRCVCAKGIHSVGDLVVYIGIDSLVPQIESFSFLEKVGYRVKSIKLRGQISQGVVLPLSEAIAINEKHFNEFPISTEIDSDVTKCLGIKKYVKPQDYVPSDAFGKFPNFLIKTDQQNIKSSFGIYHKYQDNLFSITEKLDGSSVTFFNLFGAEAETHRKELVVDNNYFGVCSRNLQMKLADGSRFKYISDLYHIPDALKGMNVAIQGELVGPKINGNNLKLTQFDYYVYDVFDIVNRRYYDHDEFVDFCSCRNLKTVPLIGFKTISEFKCVEEFLAFGAGNSVVNPDCRREGVVFKSDKEINDPRFGRLSFKLLNDVYLLKDEV